MQSLGYERGRVVERKERASCDWKDREKGQAKVKVLQVINYFLIRKVLQVKNKKNG